MYIKKARQLFLSKARDIDGVHYVLSSFFKQ